ncbi:MAG: hypothetical protein HUU41_19875, partial [Bryobacteraceae bacterium]|nr:hypothetical protein [Bryobacteraceae bacterium]
PVDDGDGESEIVGGPGRGVAGAAAAEDEEVEWGFHGGRDLDEDKSRWT